LKGKTSAMSGDFRGGKLKLKGNKQLFKKDKNSSKAGISKPKIVVDEDLDKHGGWRRISDDLDLRGGIEILIECGSASMCYLSAQDNGKFIIGAKHFEYGESPNPEEVLTLIKSPDDPKISIKTGFGKYVGVDSEGILVATSEAIGARERFEVVFQEGKSAIQSVSSGLFLSMNADDDDYVRACSRTASENEIANIRTNAEKSGPVDWRSEEDRKKAGDCELSYKKIFQHSRVDLKNKMISYDVTDKSVVKKAQVEGNLHETLLDRRAKLKSDKYC